MAETDILSKIKKSKEALVDASTFPSVEEVKKEYDEKLAEYETERKKEKEKLAQEARDRHDEYVRQRKEIAEKAQKEGEAGYKAVNDYTYAIVQAYEQQEKDGGYKGSPAQAKQELKNSLKDLWNLSATSAQQELSGAYASISSSVDTFKNAKDTVASLYKNALGQGAGMLSNAKLTYQAAILNATDKDAMLDIQKQILTQKLTNRMIMDQIVDNVQNQMLTFKSAGTLIQNTVLIQKAYVAAYVKQTFGNPQFMANVTKVIELKVDNYVDAMAIDTVGKVNTKIGGAFDRVNDKVDKISTNIISYLDKAEKIDIIAKMNSQLDKITSIEDSFNKKMEKFNNSPVGIFLAPLVGAVSLGVGSGIKAMFASSPVTEAVKKVQTKIMSLQENIVKAKRFVAEKAQMVKDYVNNLKKKAQEAVAKFAQKIVADIKSKISSAISGAFGGKGVSL